MCLGILVGRWCIYCLICAFEVDGRLLLDAVLEGIWMDGERGGDVRMMNIGIKD
jgi:hypothetical protein